MKRPGSYLKLLLRAFAVCAAVLHARIGMTAETAFSKGTADMGETLYNGIQLPAEWPPRYTKTQFTAQAAAELTTVETPYLLEPPDVIPIAVGRQLFVDDFLIEETSMQRSFHRPEYHPACPVLMPDRPWEHLPGPKGDYPTAMPFSDGVWYDPAENLFKMWYLAGYVQATAYATSRDGIRWEKPDLEIERHEGKPTNIVMTQKRDSSTVWLDLSEHDPARRYKAYITRPSGMLFFSPDGINWSKAADAPSVFDRSTMFYNPFRGVWCFSIKGYYGSDNAVFGRFRLYLEDKEILSAARRLSSNWPSGKSGEPVLWARADSLDPMRPELGVQPELYNLDAAAYESLMIGLFSIWQGQPKERPKPNYLAVGFSRDGFHWHRPDRRPFIAVSENRGDWNWGNVQSAGGCCLVVGDKLYFYVSGRSGQERAGKGESGVCSTGLAVMRRDGFASMDAGESECALTTRKLKFGGRHLFVNAAIGEGGELRAEFLDANGEVIAPFSRNNCEPAKGDGTCMRVEWTHGKDLSEIAAKPARIRFHLTRGSLYAFWIGQDESGASLGYVAAGGPGFTGPADTAGSAAYEAAQEINPK